MLILLCLSSFPLAAQWQDSASTSNVFIITIDGLRWQEVFRGMDDDIVRGGTYVADTAIVRELYAAEEIRERRKKLMPFLWSVIAGKGQLYGNRDHGNHMNVTNWYKFSYPGYNEMLTGYADRRCIPNTPVLNERTNVLEFLNKDPEYAGKVAAFTSWNIFPYILNEQRSAIMVNSGYESLRNEDGDPEYPLIDSVQQLVRDQGHTRYDELTYISAREYIREKHPRVLLLAFGEADEFAHHGHYDHYLASIHNTDRMLSELWYYVQTDPFYKNNTTFIITTDHGRGRKKNTWTDHLFLIKGSREIWMAVIGPGIRALGEIKNKQFISQKQIAATVAALLGKQFHCEHKVGKRISLPRIDETIAHDRGLVLGQR